MPSDSNSSSGKTFGCGIAKDTAVVILAGGKGTRMGRVNMPKVCFEIDGVPAINRILATFKRTGFGKFLVVVGSMAEQVMQTVDKSHTFVTFVYQAEQLGTGHASQMAAKALQASGHAGPVLVTLGDKHVESTAIRTLIEGYRRTQADLALLTTPKTKGTMAASGRVFIDKSGQLLDIIERADLARQAIVDDLRRKLTGKNKVTVSVVEKVIERHISDSRKRQAAVGELLELAGKKRDISKTRLEQLLNSSKYNLSIDGKQYTAKQIETRCNQFNPSLYLFNAEAFYLGSSMIDNHNAQGEYYFTDVVKHLSSLTDDGKAQRRFKIRGVPIKSEDFIRGFNSPDELLAIQDYTRRLKAGKGRRRLTMAAKCRLGRAKYRSVRAWLSSIDSPTSKLNCWLGEVYGQHEQLHSAKLKEIAKVLKCYAKHFGSEQKVVLVRVPGRINLMGRHIDYQGGYNNFLALHCETIAVAGLRDDDTVEAVASEPRKFSAGEFSISDLMGDFTWDDWLDFVNSQWVRNMLHSSQSHWVNYIQAAMLRLQHQYNDLKIQGMNIAVHCGVPAGAGLGSNSTIVAAALQAAIGLNNLELTGEQFIDLCGQGEWFAHSTRSPASQMSVYLGKRGKITQVGYLPFHVERVVDAPTGYQVILAGPGRDTNVAPADRKFEDRTASYRLGLELLCLRCPEIAPMVEYVRDINPERLACESSDIYRMLQKISERMSRQELARSLTSDHGEMLDLIFSSHEDPGVYDVRGALLFGVAECLRSRICIDYLESGDFERFGKLARISHDGDRVSSPDGKGHYRPSSYDCSNRKLNSLISDLASEDPERVLRAQLYMQAGRYGCSTEPIDRLVDIACSVEGVAGAQLAGVGLGGYVMIVARKEAVLAVRRALTEQCRKAGTAPPSVVDYITVAGAGLAKF